jgi:hypothetical protein
MPPFCNLEFLQRHTFTIAFTEHEKFPSPLLKVKKKYVSFSEYTPCSSLHTVYYGLALFIFTNVIYDINIYLICS